VRTLGKFLAMSAGLILVIGAVAWVFLDSQGRQAVAISAAAALAVQGAAFGAANALRGQHLTVMWGVGSLIRFVSLVLYALLVAMLWRASLTPALLSFAGFLFVTMLVEPVFLKR
jgi:hypothetical protein